MIIIFRRWVIFAMFLMVKEDKGKRWEGVVVKMAKCNGGRDKVESCMTGR